MENLTVRPADVPVLLDKYAQEGQFFLASATMNLLQFGRVLTEAKALLPHGEFTGWVKEHFKVGKSTAENYMNVWKRYGNKPQFEGVSYSVLVACLPMSDDEEEKFLEGHDLKEMHARETKEAVQEAIRQARAEAADAIAEAREQGRKDAMDEAHELAMDAVSDELEQARRAQETAERRADAAANENVGLVNDLRGELTEQRAETDKYKAEMVRLEATVRDLLNGRKELTEELRAARQEISENESLLQEQQAEYERMQEQLLSAQSMIAKGDAERVVTDTLNGEAFASSVRAFMGCVMQTPYMGTAFATMHPSEKAVFAQHLEIVAAWVMDTQKALRTEVTEYAE